jgi:DNA repair photolyase
VRWKLVAEEDSSSGQGVLFDEEDVVERHVGTGEYRGLEFLEVRARRVINEVPSSSRMPFRWTINAYRGCSHACVYCMVGTTPVLMADGRHKPLADVRVGDRVHGTVREGRYRRYTTTEVLAHWCTRKIAYRVQLDDGTELIASGDHRFLTDRGWKFVTGDGCGASRRPHLTTANKLLGTGRFAAPPTHDADYRAGYLCGMVCGDGRLLRLALVGSEALGRSQAFLPQAGIETTRSAVDAVRELVRWPTWPTDAWRRGFLAGMFDAEGCYSGGVLRISNRDPEILSRTHEALKHLYFDAVIEPPRPNGVRTVRVRGGLQEHLRFLHTVDPAITRKRSIEGRALKNDAELHVVAVEPLGLELPMYDITTGTGDFIADGIVSHNCFARPTHDYLGLGIGEDFDSKIVVKVNAVERVRAELAGRRWAGEPIAMGTNTDPYQRCEGKYHLTQGIVGALAEARNPFSILTKSTLILRDLPLLVEASKRTKVRVNLSIGTLDEATWKATEPGTPHPRQRVEAVRRINEAGVPCGVLVAPVIPGMSDRPELVEEVVRACRDAGAVSVSAMLLHLRPVVKQHYLAWLAQHRPDLLATYERRYRRSGYLPKADQEPLRDIVRRVLAEVRSPDR